MKAMMKLRSQLVAVVCITLVLLLSCIELIETRELSPSTYHGKTLRADFKRVELSRNDPCHGTPGAGDWIDC